MNLWTSESRTRPASSRFHRVAEPQRPATPWWWPALVAVAIVLAVVWLVSAVLGFLLGLVKLAVLVILGIAVVSWVIRLKADR